MKVLHVLPSLSLTLGGPTQVGLNLVRALRDIGIDAEIATTNDDQTGVLDVPIGHRVNYEGIPVWFFPRFPLRMKEFLYSPQMQPWFRRNLLNYDLLETHYLFSYAPSCAASVARQLGVPYIMRTIGQLAPWALGQSKWKKRVYINLIEMKNLNDAAAIHCTSLGEVEDATRFGLRSPKIVLPLGVDVPLLIPGAKQKLRHKYNLPEQVPIIVFLSRLHYKKRPDLLIQAMGQIAKKKNLFYLIIAGTGEPTYTKELHRLVTELDLAHSTTFTGFVSGYDKDLLLQGSDLFVLPTYSENFGLALAEAMIAGLPIITTLGAQIAPEISCCKAGIIVETNLEALQAAVLQLLNSPKLCRELGQNGQRFAHEHYSWHSIAQKLALAYQAVLDRQPLPDCVTPL